jgi:hypothetical protein
MRERSPGSLKEDSIKRAVVLKEYPEALGDSKDRVAMRDVFDNFAVNMLCELHRSLCSTGGTDLAAFAREGDQERVFAAITVYPSGAVSEDSTVKVLCEGFSDLIP